MGRPGLSKRSKMLLEETDFALWQGGRRDSCFTRPVDETIEARLQRVSRHRREDLRDFASSVWARQRHNGVAFSRLQFLQNSM